MSSDLPVEGHLDDSLLPAGWPQPILDHLDVGIAVVDQAGRIIWCNRAAQACLPIQFRTSDVAAWPELLTAGLSDNCRTSAESFPPLVALAGSTPDEVLIQAHLPASPPQWWYLGAIPLSLSSDATSAAAIVTIRDVTDRHETRLKSVEAARLAGISEMITGLAHESRNALQRSQACLDVLSIKLGDRADARDLIGRIQKAQDHLHRLYEEVRAYAAPIKLARHAVNLNDVLLDAWHSLAAVSAEKSGRLAVEPTSIDPTCDADPHAMQHVLYQVLDNALGTGEQPAIVARWTEDPTAETLSLTLHDNGPGFASRDQGRIFEPFYTTKTQGTGLGMAVAKRIVEAHGGRIAACNAPQGGAEVTITLPRTHR